MIQIPANLVKLAYDYLCTRPYKECGLLIRAFEILLNPNPEPEKKAKPKVKEKKNGTSGKQGTSD